MTVEHTGQVVIRLNGEEIRTKGVAMLRLGPPLWWLALEATEEYIRQQMILAWPDQPWGFAGELPTWCQEYARNVGRLYGVTK